MSMRGSTEVQKRTVVEQDGAVPFLRLNEFGYALRLCFLTNVALDDLDRAL